MTPDNKYAYTIQQEFSIDSVFSSYCRISSYSGCASRLSVTLNVCNQACLVPAMK